MTDSDALKYAIKKLSTQEGALASLMAAGHKNREAEYKELVDVLARLEIMLKREQRQGRMF